IVNAMPAVALLFDPFRNAVFNIFIGRSQIPGWRARNGFIAVFTRVTFGRLKFSMYTFMRKVQEEGLLLVVILHPADGVVSDKVGNVSRVFVLHPVAVDIQRWVIVLPLPA